MPGNLRNSTQVVLLVRTHRRIYALSLENIVEVMRPLATEAIPEMPLFLRGLAIIRGEPVPVVDLDILCDRPNASSPGRFVLVRVDRRLVALAVEAVLGIFRLEHALQQELPPLLRDANAELVAAVGVRDQQLFLVLQTTHLVPDAVWQELQSQEGVS